MQTTMRVTPEAGTLFLSGRFTVGGHRDLLPDVVRRQAAHGSSRIEVDLHDVSYMDCACLGEIVDAAMALERTGGRLTVARAPARVQRLLDMSRLSRTLCARPRSVSRQPVKRPPSTAALSGAVA